MIYTPMTKKAMKLAYQAHMGQVDKGGVPYVFHPLHLAEGMRTEESVTVALLHDVVEDTPITLADLAKEGFPHQVLEALEVLTHEPETPYLTYIAQVKQNPLARVVKLADLQHNQDVTRLDRVDERAKERVNLYREALALLEKF